MSNYLRHVHTLFTKLFKLVKYAHATWTSPDETNSLRRHFFLTEAVKSVIKQTVLIISNIKSEEKKQHAFKNWPLIKNPQFFSYFNET